MSSSRKAWNNAVKAIIWVCVLITVALLVGLIGYIMVRGLPYITVQLLTTQRSAINGTIGILPNIIFTIYLILTTLLVALPIGIGGAIYLTEYAKNCRLVSVIEFATESLAGIPSIIYGLVGMMVFVQGMSMGSGILAGSLTLAIMILPNILRTTQEALKIVPQSYREGSVGLGATKWHTIWTIVLPCTLDGVVGGAILSVGKIVGESAALLYTAGTGYKLVTNYIQALGTSSGSLSVMLYVYYQEYGEVDLAFAIAAILMIIVLIINFMAKFAKTKLKKGK
ncbi:MAG: phosphate ABC transporter permease PstA [Clostridiales bacterium]|nr:phosphate ABC transporter permease PstA [Clostridiales bacterium]